RMFPRRKPSAIAQLYHRCARARGVGARAMVVSSFAHALVLGALTVGCSVDGEHTGRSAYAAAPPASTWRAPAIKVPVEHPRLWWTPARLARGREWAKHHPMRSGPDASPSENALRFLLA